MKILKTVLLSTALMMGTTFGSENVVGPGNVLPNSGNVEDIYTKYKEFQSTVKRTVIRVLTRDGKGQEAETITLNNGVKLDKESSVKDVLVGASTLIKELVKKRDELEKALLEASAAATLVEETTANALKKNNDELTAAKELIDQLTSELDALKGENAVLKDKAETLEKAIKDEKESMEEEINNETNALGTV